MSATEPIAVYERRVAASAERVWENVRDWEHLPALHSDAFGAIDCEDAGAWGWRAVIQPRHGADTFTVELRIDDDGRGYHSRTVAGPGTGGDIYTRVDPVDDAHTDVHVSFFDPNAPADQRAARGRAMVRLYTQLWDEDEAMMQHRAAFLSGEAPAVARRSSAKVALGPEMEARARAPFSVEADGHPFRVLIHGDALFAHTEVCPHWGASLANASIANDDIVCPWHGYRFDLRSGAGPEGQACRLLVRARVEVDGAGDAWLVTT